MLGTSTSRWLSQESRSNGDGNTMVDPNDLRTLFAASLASMYREEAPLYGDLVRIVRDTNAQVLSKGGAPVEVDSAQRISLERHGAIRLGTPHELHTVRRVFNLMGMHAVDYYDLSVAGLPMHACAFRPIQADALARNPFRVFTTLLRPELLSDERARKTAMELLQKRNIFSRGLMDLLKWAEKRGGWLTVDEVETFVSEALLTFRWRSMAAATDEEYERLRFEHPILADIACFKSAHINHLTPRTLDIDLAYKSMSAAGLAVKDSIEGPPRRVNPIFLRQTSFLALQEPVQFPTARSQGTEDTVSGCHKARFGEIEERGAALTPKGRRLYNDLLWRATCEAGKAVDGGQRKLIFERIFSEFPDKIEVMRAENFIFCVYQAVGEASEARRVGSPEELLERSLIDTLVQNGTLQVRTMTYEDFLPFSAAGIFQSNLEAAKSPSLAEGRPDKDGFEKALGAQVQESDALYRTVEMESLQRCARELGLTFDARSFDNSLLM